MGMYYLACKECDDSSKQDVGKLHVSELYTTLLPESIVQAGDVLCGVLKGSKVWVDEGSQTQPEHPGSRHVDGANQ